MKNLLLLLFVIISINGYSQQRLDVITKDAAGVDSTVQKFTDDATTGYIYFKNDTLWSKAKDTIRCLSCRISIGGHALLKDTATLCAVAGTWYKIQGRWKNGHSNNFTTDGANKLTYTGFNNALCAGVGDSELKADKNCIITYGMYVNGVLDTRMESTVDVLNGKWTSVGINRSVTLRRGDYFEVYVKSDTDNTTVTSATLMLTVSCDR